MTEAKLAPNLPDWMVEHTKRYLASGGTDGHMYKMTQPGRPEMTVPSLLLTTTGRKSGERFIFPLFYGTTGDSYIVVASKGGALNWLRSATLPSATSSTSAPPGCCRILSAHLQASHRWFATMRSSGLLSKRRSGTKPTAAG